MNRRTFLLGAAATVLSGCAGGKDDPRLGTQQRELAKRSVGIDYASFYAPFEDAKRLAGARAAEVGAALTFSEDANGTGAQVSNLKRWTGPSGGFRAIAVAPFDVRAVDAVLGGVDGVAIIAYVTELPRQTAAITVDRAAMGTQLAQQAAKAGDGGVLLVRPPAKPAIADPFAPGFADAEAAIRTVVDVKATVEAQAQVDAGPAVAAALDADKSLTTVLCWNDTTALGAVEAAGDDTFVGALGAPSLSGTAALDALDSDGPLRCLVAARLSDLAIALVDIPLAYARGEKPGSRAIEAAVITPGSPERKAFAADFAG